MILQDSEEEEEYGSPPDSPPPQRVTRQKAKRTLEDSPSNLQHSSSNPVAQKQKKWKVISPTTNPVDLFSGPRAIKKYPSFAQKMGHTPKVFSSSMILAYPHIKSVVDAFQWETLFSCIGEYNLDWVREFFTELSVTHGTELMVRQTPVSYSPEAINDLLGLTPPKESEFDRLQTRVSEEELDMILEKLAIEGAEWTIKLKCRTLKTCYLKGEVNVWFYFLRHTLFPTSHDTNLCMERVYYLYCIVECLPFNVGRLICRAMKSSVDRANSRLPYPSIIHKLMERAQVPALESDDISREKTIVDKQSLLRLMRYSDAPENPAGNEPFATVLDTLKKDLLDAMEEQTKAIQKTVRVKTKKLKEKINALQADVDDLKAEGVQWALHQQQKEQIRQAYQLGKAKKPMKMPPLPKSILLRNMAPTPSE